jgi:ABC-type transporter Mla MlaB component
MVAANEIRITHGSPLLTYADARGIARRALGLSQTPVVCVNLEQTVDTSTGALARLVLLRSDLLKGGRDLRLVGLGGRARALYEIHHMETLVPSDAAPSLGSIRRPGDGPRGAVGIPRDGRS